MIKLWSFIKGIAIQNESDRTKQMALEVDTTASSGTVTTVKSAQTLSRTLTLPNVSGELVEKDAAQTLTNKTIDGDTNTVQDLALSSLKTVLADADKFVSRDVSGQVVAVKAVPVGVVVGNSDTQTLTNKTIDADSNTISNIDNADIKSGAAIDAVKIHDGSVSNTEYGYLDGVTSSIQTQLNAKAQISGATDNRLVRTDGATAIQQSGITVDDSNNVTGVNNLTVDGNLTVNGTTTTVNSATLNVTDTNITVNNGGTNGTAEGAGLTVDRTGTDGSLVYEDALASKWKAGALGAEIQLANVSSSQSLTNKNLKSNTNLLTGAKANTFERETGNAQVFTIPDSTIPDTFVTQAFSQTLTNKDYDGGTASNTSRITVPKDTLTNLLALTRKEGTILYATDTDKFYRDDGSNLQEIGSGSGEKNFISNGDAEAGTIGWATYADAAGTRPVDGTGGSPTVTFTRSTSTPLEGQGSFLFTKDAANRQGQGASYDFTIDSAYKAKVLTIEMDYIVNSGTFVAGSSSTDSDVIAYIYDVTNSTLIEPSSIKLLSNSSTISDKFKASFQTSATGTSYRLILHVASTSASAYVLKIDNIKVSPSKYIFGTPITDWNSFTPTGSWTTNSTYTGFWRRVGDSMEVDWRVSLTGAPNNVSLTLNLPGGYSIDSAKIVTAGFQPKFNRVFITSASNNYNGIILSSTATAILVRYLNTQTGTNPQPVLTANLSSTTPNTFGSGDGVIVTASFPIVGWSSSVQTSDETSTRVVSAAGSGNPNNTITGTLSKATWASTPINNDDHEAWSTANNYYVVPVSGVYHVKFSTEISQTTVLGSSASAAIVHRNSAGTILSTRTGFDRAFGAGTTTQYTLSETQLVCVNGDTIEFQTAATGTAPTYSSSIAGTSFNIERVSGPSAIAASETISLKYQNNAGTSIAAAGTSQVPYATKMHDTHNAWNGNTFTAPISGKYRVSVNAFYASASWTGSATMSISLRKNTTVVDFLSVLTKQGITAQQGLNGSSEIDLISGDTLDIRLVHNEGTARLLDTSATGLNYICITRVGN